MLPYNRIRHYPFIQIISQKHHKDYRRVFFFEYYITDLKMQNLLCETDHGDLLYL